MRQWGNGKAMSLGARDFESNNSRPLGGNHHQSKCHMCTGELKIWTSQSSPYVICGCQGQIGTALT